MSLFLILTAITFINAYKTRLVSLVLKLIPQDSQIKSKRCDIISMEKELSTISMVNEFARHVKLQRKINKLRDEKKELAKKHAFKIMKIRYAFITALYIIIICSLITLIWLYRSEPVATVPPQWLWPVESLFDWSNHTPGFITVPCWIAISSSASKTFAKHF